MPDRPHDIVSAKRARRFGVASLVVACLAVASQLLIVVIGVLAAFLLFPLALIAVACGLVGLIAGIRDKDWMGSLSGALGLTLVGWLVWSSLGNVTRF